MPEADLFDVYYRGQLINGYTKEQALQLLSARLKTSPEKTAAIIDANNCRISRDIHLDKAKRLKQHFSTCGLELVIIHSGTIMLPEENNTQTHQAEPQTPVEPQGTLPQQQGQPKEQEDNGGKKFNPKAIGILIGIVVSAALLYYFWKHIKLIGIAVALLITAYIALKISLAISPNSKHTRGRPLADRVRIELHISSNVEGSWDFFSKICFFLFVWFLVAAAALWGLEKMGFHLAGYFPL